MSLIVRRRLGATNLGSVGPSFIDEVLGDGLHWITSEAGCAQVDREMFFVEKGRSTSDAKRVCRSCPLINECFAYAMESHEWGIWGGTSEKERAHLRRRAAA